MRSIKKVLKYPFTNFELGEFKFFSKTYNPRTGRRIKKDANVYRKINEMLNRLEHTKKLKRNIFTCYIELPNEIANLIVSFSGNDHNQVIYAEGVTSKSSEFFCCINKMSFIRNNWNKYLGKCTNFCRLKSGQWKTIEMSKGGNINLWKTFNSSSIDYSAHELYLVKLTYNCKRNVLFCRSDNKEDLDHIIRYMLQKLKSMFNKKKRYKVKFELFKIKTNNQRKKVLVRLTLKLAFPWVIQVKDSLSYSNSFKVMKDYIFHQIDKFCPYNNMVNEISYLLERSQSIIINFIPEDDDLSVNKIASIWKKLKNKFRISKFIPPDFSNEMKSYICNENSTFIINNGVNILSNVKSINEFWTEILEEILYFKWNKDYFMFPCSSYNFRSELNFIKIINKNNENYTKKMSSIKDKKPGQIFNPNNRSISWKYSSALKHIKKKLSKIIGCDMKCIAIKDPIDDIYAIEYFQWHFLQCRREQIKISLVFDTYGWLNFHKSNLFISFNKDINLSLG